MNEAISEPESSKITNSYEIEVFFDGACPFCSREIRWLRRIDKSGRMLFTDISADGFQPERFGKTIEILMEQIHARTKQGEWLTGVEVFRHIYEIVGFRKLVQFSRWPIVSQLLQLGYRIFAPIRLRIAGGCKAGGKCRLKNEDFASVHDLHNRDSDSPDRHYSKEPAQV